MKRARFSEEQIVGILKEHEAGTEGGRVGPRARSERGHAVWLEE